METLAPNQTLYVQNLTDKENVAEVKRNLYCLFSQYGVVLDINVINKEGQRGQAFVAFKEQTSANMAVRAAQGFTFFGRPIRVQYARNTSKVIAEPRGEWKDPKQQQQEQSTASAVSSSAATKRVREETNVHCVHAGLSTMVAPETAFQALEGYLKIRQVGKESGGIVPVQVEFASLDSARGAVRYLSSKGIQATIK
eukprot:PhF_6_TR6853/c1_g1_i1/m.9868/K11094/SNRPB2; U2 small nuclear ribonucleoprotein B''